MQLLLYASAPELTHPFIRAPILSIHKSRKSDVFTSFPYSTLSSRNFRFSVRPSCYPSSVLIHSWNRIFSSGFRKCMWSSVPLVQLSRLILVFSLASILEGEAYGKPGPPSTYSCDDVQSYYSSAQHKKGKALKKALHVIVEGHQSLSYKEVWDALKILDASEVNDPESSSEIVEIYSLRVVSKQLAGKSEGWNREHLWPRSYGLTHGPSLTDLHNIRPADVNVNSSRGNKYFGECCNDSIDCLKPANKEAALDTEADKEKWAPPKQVRGDIARALMYMAVRYGFHDPGSPVLKLSDSPSLKSREMGLLSTLLKWNEIDPPSREEKMRNERICKIYQHNRNPFIDHPEYAKLIWKQGNPNCQRLHQSQMTPLKQRTSRFESNRVAKTTVVS